LSSRSTTRLYTPRAASRITMSSASSPPAVASPAQYGVEPVPAAGAAAQGVRAVLAAVQDRPAVEVARTDIAAGLAPFDLSRQLSANRTQGVPNMIALIRTTAERLAG